MQKWEYRFIEVSSANGTFYASAVNGHEIKNWEHMITLMEYSNQLGEQGWELIGEGARTGCLIFKRPKVD